MRRCLDIIGEALADAGSSMDDVVRIRCYLIDVADFEKIGPICGEYFHDVRPANTTVAVAALLDPRWKVEVEVEAIIPKDKMPA